MYVILDQTRSVKWSNMQQGVPRLEWHRNSERKLQQEWTLRILKFIIKKGSLYLIRLEGSKVEERCSMIILQIVCQLEMIEAKVPLGCSKERRLNEGRNEEIRDQI